MEKLKKQTTWRYADWSAGYDLGQLTANILKLVLIGTVANMSDLQNFFIRLRSTADFTDYTNSFEISTIDNGLVQIESTLKSVHKTRMTIEMLTPQIFTSITQGFILIELE